jgi:hypothetical protein
MDTELLPEMTPALFCTAPPMVTFWPVTRPPVLFSVPLPASSVMLRPATCWPAVLMPWARTVRSRPNWYCRPVAAKSKFAPLPRVRSRPARACAPVAVPAPVPVAMRSRPASKPALVMFRAPSLAITLTSPGLAMLARVASTPAPVTATDVLAETVASIRATPPPVSATDWPACQVLLTALKAPVPALAVRAPAACTLARSASRLVACASSDPPALTLASLSWAAPARNVMFVPLAKMDPLAVSAPPWVFRERAPPATMLPPSLARPWLCSVSVVPVVARAIRLPAVLFKAPLPALRLIVCALTLPAPRSMP